MAEIIVIKNALILTMDEHRRLIEDGAIAIEGDKIVNVGKTDDIMRMHKADVIVDGKDKLVMPGLIDLHFHCGLARGVADDQPLDEWLFKFWYPKVRSLKPDEAYVAASISYAEAIKSGVTCVNDMYFRMLRVADAAEEIGIRAVLSSDVADESEGLETLQDNEKLFLEKHGKAGGRITVRFGVEWVPIAAPELLTRTRELAHKHKAGIHIHLNESRSELELSLRRHGKRSVELAYDAGVLGPDCVAAHCVWLTDSEIRMLADTGTPVSHNPSSNAKLGNGIAPIPDLLGAGVTVGLGHDNALCNNNIDLFEVMKWASLIHRAHRADASLMPAAKVLEMATKDGAKALNMEHLIGSLETGKKADLILINLKSLHCTPLIHGKHTNIFSHLVYAAHGEDVDTVIVDGKIVMENRVLKTVDEREVIRKATDTAREVVARIL